jgi:SAM-dependent methyltransferase
VALIEARKRIGAHGLFVVTDIANLPFKPGCFEGIVSLHTIHHLPLDEHAQAYAELYRLLAPGSSAVVVNGWDSAPLVVLVNGLIRVAEWVYALKARLTGKLVINNLRQNTSPLSVTENQQSTISNPQPTGTFVRKHNAAWLKKEIGSRMPVEIWTWRSVSVRFLRTLIHERWGGRILLRGLFWLEERFPHFCGKNGQYPLVVVRKLL